MRYLLALALPLSLFLLHPTSAVAQENELEDNAYTILDIADIVMVDPIGTGFSHTLGDTPGSYYWGIDEDARSLAQFIRRFLSEYERWNSPRYLLGESQGTTRSAVLARLLRQWKDTLDDFILRTSGQPAPATQ